MLDTGEWRENRFLVRELGFSGAARQRSWLHQRFETEPPYERSTLKSAVNALTAFIQKSGDVHIHESCPCSESRSFRNLDSATWKIHFTRLGANPMSSRLAPKVANEVSHGVNLIRTTDDFMPGPVR